jgi:UrcA family protein
MKSTTSIAPRRSLYAALLSACFAAGAVQAGESCAVATQVTRATPAAGAVTVRYADLDLSTSAGASALYARISRAAHQVCDSGDVRDVERRAAADHCEHAAIAQAVGTVHSPQLAALVSVKLPHG